MKITILAIGKKHEPKLESAILDYTARLNHYTKCEWKLLEAKITPSLEIEQIKQVESDLIRKQINQKDAVILLDERGSDLTSPALAERIQKLMNSGIQNLVFVIGGAYGVDESLMERADLILSFSKLVFPHQLVRLILIEQLYRAHTILAGEKYHHI
jgi:23S rRNA (pseudouridine1915-N3)-methyltransferase